MSEVGALAGLIATVALIACAILIYHQVQMQRQLDNLQESVRSLGIHMKVPEHELPPSLSSDEYAPDAVVDTVEAEREWQLPREWRSGWER